MDERCTKGGSARYFTTENEEKFKENARIFLPEGIEVSHLSLE